MPEDALGIDVLAGLKFQPHFARLDEIAAVTLVALTKYALAAFKPHRPQALQNGLTVFCGKRIKRFEKSHGTACLMMLRTQATDGVTPDDWIE
jgi:hypothetical protein